MIERTLLLLRHAQAYKDHDDGDQARELKDKGKRNAQRMGVWLAQNRLVPQLILSSPAERAHNTAAKTIKASGHSSALIEKRPTLYSGDNAKLTQMIKEVPNDITCLMLVGHNPTLELLATELSRDKLPKTKTGKYLPKGALCVLKLETDWAHLQAGCARLDGMVYPKKLPEFFPFPMPFGKERRVRPAYYYHQSCVIPYRISAEGLEILIVSSSSQKHWVVPKGIHDPGLSAQASAAQEAFEEAGVRGRVIETPLGRYSYEKWESTCTVEVFAMEVTKEIPVQKWEESHRQRLWVSVEAAIERVKNKDLAQLISTLPPFLQGLET